MHPILPCQAWLRRYPHKSRIPDSAFPSWSWGWKGRGRGGRRLSAAGTAPRGLSPPQRSPSDFTPQLVPCGSHFPRRNGMADKALPPSEACEQLLLIKEGKTLCLELGKGWEELPTPSQTPWRLCIQALRAHPWAAPLLPLSHLEITSTGKFLPF